MRAATVAPLPAWIGRRILIEIRPALRCRAIAGAVADGADHWLTLSSNLGAPIPLGTEVHRVTAMRVDDDRVEIRHGVGASEVTVPVPEVPA